MWCTRKPHFSFYCQCGFGLRRGRPWMAVQNLLIICLDDELRACCDIERFARCINIILVHTRKFSLPLPLPSHSLSLSLYFSVIFSHTISPSPPYSLSLPLPLRLFVCISSPISFLSLYLFLSLSLSLHLPPHRLSFFSWSPSTSFSWVARHRRFINLSLNHGYCERQERASYGA